MNSSTSWPKRLECAWASGNLSSFASFASVTDMFVNSSRINGRSLFLRLDLWELVVYQLCIRYKPVCELLKVIIKAFGVWPVGI